MSNQQRPRFRFAVLPALLCLAAIHVFGVPVTASSSLCGPITGTLSAAGSPWVATCDISVKLGETLIVDPGVELRFKAGWTLRILGTSGITSTCGTPT